MNITKSLYVIILLNILILYLLFPSNLYAKVYIDDSFERQDIGTSWEFVQGSGNYENTWVIENGKLKGEIGYEGSSFLFANTGSTLSTYDISFEATNIRGVDQDILFGLNEERTEYYIANFRYADSSWGDSNMVRLWLFVNGSYTKIAEVKPSDLSNSFSLTQNVDHKIYIDVDQGNIKIYFDDVKIIDMYDSNLSITHGIGLMNWAGSYFYGTVLNKFDNIRVTDKKQEKVREKIIILPGLGASWNEKAMVLGQEVDDSEWKMTPFVNNYQNLITSLETNGLKRDVDFFVWNYDWRKPVDEIKQKLNIFISQKIVEGDKVDLVGHSLGGLVARVWAQDNKNNPKLGKVLTLGSPHFGAVKAYKAWNGAVVSDKFDFASIAMKVMIMLQKKNFDNDVATIREIAPVVKDLLPVFDFVKKNGNQVPYSQLNTKNIFLQDKNINVNQIYPNLTTVVAKGVLTEEWVNLRHRSVFDQIMGVWEDGHYIGSENGEGDGTVLSKSAGFSDDPTYEINSTHGDMVDGSINYIIESLGLGITGNIDLNNSTWDKKLVFYIGSPVKMKVKCDEDGVIEAVGGYVVVENNNYRGCRIYLEGVESGTYHLVTGNTKNDGFWNYFEDEIGIGKTEVFTISASNGNLANDESSEELLFGQISRLLNLLLKEYPDNKFLTEAISALEDRRVDKFLRQYFQFIKQTDETRYLSLIIRYSEQVVYFQKFKCDLKKADYDIRGLRRLLTLTDKGLESKFKTVFKASISNLKLLALLDRMVSEAEADDRKDCRGLFTKVTISNILRESVW